MTSIRARLTAWYAGILAVTFLALGLGVWVAIQKSIDDTLDADLLARVARARAFMMTVPGGPGEIAEELSEQAVLASTGTYIRLAGPAGGWVYRSAGAETWSLKLPQLKTGEVLTETLWVRDNKFRVITAPTHVGTLQIAVSTSGYDAVLSKFKVTMILASPLALLLASVGGYWMSRRALAPVDKIAATAREIGTRRLSARLPVRTGGDELDRLSSTLNDMFGRLESGILRMSQFTADASHELRTPAAIIRTTAEIATSRPRSAEQHVESWKMVLAESERTGRLLEDLMTLARADAGASLQDADLFPMDLAACVRGACTAASILADMAGITLTTGICGPMMISGDPEMLRRLCLILLDNAVKYTPDGGRIRVDLCARDGNAVLEVHDTGIGIGSDDLPHVFNRFYRASKDRSRKSGGAGLGLAIADLLVMQHGGTIMAESGAGSGSCFRISLPLFTASSEIKSTIAE